MEVIPRMNKTTIIFISFLYVIFILLNNSFAPAYSQQITSNNMIMPLPNLSANHSILGNQDPPLSIRLRDNTGQVQPGDFTVDVRNNGIIVETFPFPPDKTVQLNQGSYSVEVREARLINRFVVNPSLDCSGQIVDQLKTCILTVNSASLRSELQSLRIAGGGTTSSSGGNESSSQHLLPERQANIVVEKRDELFEPCRAATVTPVNGGTATPIVPSSALYTIEGTADIGKIANGLKNDEPITFDIKGDLFQNDNVGVSISNPTLIASIQTGEDPFPIKLTPFKINKITTDCKFYTVVKPNAQDSTGRLAPKGEEKIKTIGDIDKNNKNIHVKSPPIPPFVLRSDGGKVTSNVVNTLAVDPPFRACRPVVDGDDGGKVATYILRGTPEISKISFSGKHILSVRIFVDLVPDFDDLAKIVNTNTNVVRVELVADPGKSNAQVIDFPVTEISTDCLGVGFSTNPVVS
jgi:hypothetical protein